MDTKLEKDSGLKKNSELEKGSGLENDSGPEKDSELERVKDAVVKKALGEEIVEEVLEYGLDENGEEKLLKRKRCIKKMPIDVQAVKLYLEVFKDKFKDPYEGKTTEELIIEGDKIVSEYLKSKEKYYYKKKLEATKLGENVEM